MVKNILVTGGIKSGKSSYALELADKYKGEKIFLATARAFDDEMAEKIERHKAERSDSYKTIEEPIKIGKIISEVSSTLLVIDCITIWLSNLFFETEPEQRNIYVNEFLESIKNFNGEIIIVTNEVGSGIIPENKISREYQSELGKLNQEIAKLCDEVYLLVSGVAVKIKEQ